MPVQKIQIEEFLQLAQEHPVIDVRSPGEYRHAHIPGAYSLPLFTDEERAVTGTAYKQQSREDAIKVGLEFFGPKMRIMAEEVENLFHKRNKAALPSKTVLVHCWRGGMRSAGVAWLLDLYGFKVYTLIGGYKLFRQWTLQQFEKEYDIMVVGGFTGSGKTKVLHEMKGSGANVVDLEDIANHKGSAFGAIDMPAQPTQEMFENKLAVELWKIVDGCKMRDDDGEKSNNGSLSSVSKHLSTSLWLEDESQRIGNVNIPTTLWKQIRTKAVVFLQVPFEERLSLLVRDYGTADKEKLIEAVDRIKKRLGGLETKTAINFLLEDNVRESFRILLHYYDKQYTKGLLSRENVEELVTEIACDTTDAVLNAQKILQLKRKTENG